MNEEKLTYEMLSEDQKAVYDFNLPDIYYKYKLKGTVVHYGTADGGHYYSFIKERGTDKWHEFNDTNVREYDPNDLEEDSFGGNLKYQRKVTQSGKTYIETEKLNSSYVLIYEREEFLDNNKLFELYDNDVKDLDKKVKSYSIPLKPLKIEDEILDDLTQVYDRSWIANKIFDDFFIDTVLNISQNSSSYLQLTTDRSYEQAMDLDDSEEESYKLRFTTLFFLGVVLRSESRLTFAEKVFSKLLRTASINLSYAQWIVACFSRKHSINEFFASNWSPES